MGATLATHNLHKHLGIAQAESRHGTDSLNHGDAIEAALTNITNLASDDSGLNVESRTRNGKRGGNTRNAGSVRDFNLVNAGRNVVLNQIEQFALSDFEFHD